MRLKKRLRLAYEDGYEVSIGNRKPFRSTIYGNKEPYLLTVWSTIREIKEPGNCAVRCAYTAGQKAAEEKKAQKFDDLTRELRKSGFLTDYDVQHMIDKAIHRHGDFHHSPHPSQSPAEKSPK